MNTPITTSATLDLADAIERAAWRDLMGVAAARAGPELLPRWGEVDGAELLAVPGVHHLMLNHAFGARPERAHLAAIVAWFAEREVGSYLVQLPREARSPELERTAGELGLERFHRSWVKVMRGPGEPPAIRDIGLELRHATAADADRPGEIYCAGFDLPEAFAPAITGLVDRPGWEVHVACERGRPVAVGVLYHEAGVGYLVGGATSPSHRRRGAQGALVAVRTRRALELGCRWIASETGEEVAGEPQHSFRNMRRCGFEVIGVRDNWVPVGSRWSGPRVDEDAG